MDEIEIEREAEARVKAIRDSDDVPGYWICIRAEMDNIREELKNAK